MKIRAAPRLSYVSSIIIVYIWAGSVLALVHGHLLLQRSTVEEALKDSGDVLGTGKASQQEVVVSTPLGDVKGVQEDGVNVFHGIPFAKPPLNELRWKPPQAPDAWSPQTFDATKPRPACMQECDSFLCIPDKSEDCLYLKITAPAAAKPNSKLPVDFYIHGGAFRSYSASSPVLDPKEFVKKTGIIVVNIQYRLSSLGFLVTGTSEDDAHGNYGLQDQRMALQWVHDHIGAFGGDPAKVTMHGQSAGAQSAIIHLTSMGNTDLFHRLILESNPLTLSYLDPAEATDSGRRMAELLGCTTPGGEPDMVCLRGKDPDTILSMEGTVSKERVNYFSRLQPFGPVVDGKIVQDQPLPALEKYSKTSIPEKPIMVGLVKEEAYIYVNALFPKASSYLTYFAFQYVIFEDRIWTMQLLYFCTTLKDTRPCIAQVGTDALFKCPSRNFINHFYSDGRTKVWAYQWNHKAKTNVPPPFDIFNDRATHGIEVPYVFQSISQLGVKPDPSDMKMSNLIVDYVANFVRSGDPNSNPQQGSQQLEFWPRAKQSSSTFSQLIFAQNKLKVQTKKYEDLYICNEWDKRGYELELNFG